MHVDENEVEACLKPRSRDMCEQITAYFMVSTAATSFASVVDCTVSPGSPNLKLTELRERRHDGAGSPSYAIMHHFSSENVLELEPSYL